MKLSPKKAINDLADQSSSSKLVNYHPSSPPPPDDSSSLRSLASATSPIPVNRSTMNEVIASSNASSTLRSGAYQPSLIPWNLPLLSALLSLALAQFLKPFSCWFKERRWNSRKMLGSGGMPSSHSATVTALAVSIGLQEGVEGSVFAIAAVLACVVMYDASGVRLHAGLQAELLNQIVCELPPEHPVSSIKPLRDSLGHTPVQVIAGSMLGCVVALLMRN